MKKLLCFSLTMLLLTGAGGLVLSNVQSEQRTQANLQALQLVDPMESESPSPSLPCVEGLSGTVLEELQAVNPDVIGWIHIPDTSISYPLLQGEDNHYYLEHTWQGEYNAGGSIFMECRNNRDLSSFNTILYGHRMSDDSMFHSLHHYDDMEYWEEHPRVYIVREDGVHIYEIFAAMKVTITDPVYWLITTQESYKQKLIDFCLERSVLTTGIVPGPADKLLTLSTCTGLTVSDERWVVVAVYAATA